MKKTFIPFVLFLSLVLPFVAGLSADDPDVKTAAEPAKTWTALFDRSEIWLGADGIFSIPLDGVDDPASATERSRTLFVFSDSMVGTADPVTKKFKDANMVNHSAAVLDGAEPLPDKIRFVYGKHGDMSRSNLFDMNCWLQDGIAIDGTLYLTALRTGPDWKPKGIDLLSVPIGKNGVPDWPKFSRTEDFPPLRARNDEALACLGIGILDGKAGDGFVYVYGYRDDLKSQEKALIAARVERKHFADASHWTFFNGAAWGDKIEETLKKSASLAGNVSCELSVSPLPDGRFILVYTRDVMSPFLEYRIGPTPVGPFDAPVCFFKAPEPKELGEGIYAYNAKAHPHLSRPGKLLVSYNVNRFASLPHRTDEYRPRFVELSLENVTKKEQER